MPSMVDIIVVLVLALVLGGALLYIRKEKKKGVRCIGCPAAGTCAKGKNGTGCSGTDTKEH